MKSPKFLVMDSHWREYDQDATPKSWGIPSAGLAYIIASVKDQGGEIVGVEQFFTEKKDRPASIQDFFKIRDTFISKGIEKAINEHCDALLVTATTGAYHFVRRLIEKISETNLMVIIGGALVTLPNTYKQFRNILFHLSPANLVTIEGEGEPPIREIVERLKCGKDFSGIPGVTFQKDGDLLSFKGSIPRYDIHDLIYADYGDFDRSRLARFLLVSRTRGCPASCTFCDERDVFQGYRIMPNERVIGEIKHFMGHYGMTHFKWTDSTFTAREIDTRKTCEAIINHGLDKEIQWLAYARIKEVLNFDDSTLDLMKAAGCFGLHYGFETFDDSVLTGVKKGYRTIEEAREIVKRTRNAGIKITGSFMNGFPGQTQEALDLSVEYGIGLGLDVYNVHAAVPPIKQMEWPESYEVSSLFKFWNNDPNIPPNLFEEYTEWHRDIFGMEDTLGRHTTSKQLAFGVEPTVRHSAYNLSYSAEALLDSLVHFMENGRESIEYNLFFRTDRN